MDDYRAVLAELRAKRAQINSAIAVIEELDKADSDGKAASRRASEAAGATIFPTVRGKTSEAKNGRNDQKTRSIGLIIRNNPDLRTDEIHRLCKAQGIETTLNTVDELRYFYKRCMTLLSEIENGESSNENRGLNSHKIFEMCTKVSIKTTAKTVYSYWLYFHQCLDIFGK
jgi:hypothetical protein